MGRMVDLTGGANARVEASNRTSGRGYEPASGCQEENLGHGKHVDRFWEVLWRAELPGSNASCMRLPRTWWEIAASSVEGIQVCPPVNRRVDWAFGLDVLDKRVDLPIHNTHTPSNQQRLC